MRDTAPVIFTMMIISLFLIFAIVLVLSRTRTLELRLILIGVFTAVAAAVQGNIAAVDINPGNVAVSLGGSSGSLMKVAMILVLSGVTLVVLDRTGLTAASEPKEVSHGG